MVAYTVTGFVVGPVLTLTGAMLLLENLSLGSPFWGVAKGAVLTLLMMLCTWLCTKTKIFWLKDAGREDYFNSVISATFDQ